MGRKKADPDKKSKRVNVSISPDNWEKIRQIGGGCLSSGIREMLAFYETRKTKKALG